MITIAITLVVAAVGALVYALSANGKMVELGRLVFACAFLAFMLTLAGARFGLLR